MSDSVEETLALKFEQEWVNDPLRFEQLPGTTKSWPANKLVTLFRMWHSNEGQTTHDEIASVLHIDRSTVSRKLKSMDWTSFVDSLSKLCGQTSAQSIRHAAEDRRLQLLANTAIKRRRSEIDTVAMIKNLEERMLTEVAARDRVKLPEIIKRQPKVTGTPESCVLLLSDLHVGQEFSLADTGHLNEYNHTLFKERAANLRQSVIDIYKLHSQLRSLPELRIFSLGDIVQGGNMAGQWGCAYNGNIDVCEQANIAADVIFELVSAWSNYFGKIVLTGIVGNHGRAGVGKNTDKVSANWDNVCYNMLKAMFKNHKNVEIRSSQAWWARERVQNTEFMLVHGDYLKGSISSLHSEEQRLQSLIGGGKQFNYLCMGHFHTYQEMETSSGGIIVNGSFVGGDIHSMHQLRCKSKPTQTLFGIHPERGKTWNYVLQLDKKR